MSEKPTRLQRFLGFWLTALFFYRQRDRDRLWR